MTTRTRLVISSTHVYLDGIMLKRRWAAYFYLLTYRQRWGPTSTRGTCLQ
jgi:hypothetical protein